MTQHLFASTVLAAIVSASGISAASAQDGGWSFDGVPGWSNPETGNSIKLRGRIYLDTADIDFETGGATTNYQDGEIRTARLGITGTFNSVDYTAEFDFIDEEITAKDVVLTFDAGEVDIKLGHFKTPNSMEEQTSSRYITFMERGQGTDLFGLDRRVGAMVTRGGDNYSFAAGAFAGRPGDLSQTLELDDSSAFAARVTYTPVDTDAMTVHLGASTRYMDYGDAGTRVRVRPNTHITPRIVSADFRPGSVLGEADSSMFWGLEGAIIAGSFHGHTEFMTMDVDGPAGDPSFDSWFVNLGYFLTGETRSYSASSGKFGRTRPQTTLSEGGYGAVEAAVRYDVSDLDTVAAGELTTWTLGLNWYLEDHFRIMVNYIDGERTIAGAPDTDVTGAQIRVQWDF